MDSKNSPKSPLSDSSDNENKGSEQNEEPVSSLENSAVEDVSVNNDIDIENSVCMNSKVMEEAYHEKKNATISNDESKPGISETNEDVISLDAIEMSKISVESVITLSSVSSVKGNDQAAKGQESYSDSVCVKTNKREWCINLCLQIAKRNLKKKITFVWPILVGISCMVLACLVLYINFIDPEQIAALVAKHKIQDWSYIDIVRLNMPTLDTVINKSNDAMGQNIEDYYKHYKKDQTATLLFYMEKQEDPGKESSDPPSILQPTILKDIYMIKSFFENIRIQEKFTWFDICKKYDLPFRGTGCLVSSLFSVAESTLGDKMESENITTIQEQYDYIMNHYQNNTHDFFEQSMQYLPIFLYYPHTMYDTKEVDESLSLTPKSIAQYISHHVDTLLVAFTFDETIDGSFRNEWYIQMNKYVNMINEQKLETLYFSNKDGTSYKHNLQYNKGWKIATYHDFVKEENENLSAVNGLKDNFCFIIAGMLFIYIGLTLLSGNIGFIKMLVLSCSIYIFPAFSFSFCILFILFLNIQILKICFLNLLILLFMSVLFSLLYIYFYQRCLEACTKKVKDTLKEKEKCLYIEKETTSSAEKKEIEEKEIEEKEIYRAEISFEEHQIHAIGHTIYNIMKLFLIMIVLCLISYLLRSTAILRNFSLHMLINLGGFFMFYLLFFHRVFVCMYYKKNVVFTDLKEKYANAVNEAEELIAKTNEQCDKEKKKEVVLIDVDKNKKLKSIMEDEKESENPEEATKYSFTQILTLGWTLKAFIIMVILLHIALLAHIFSVRHTSHFYSSRYLHKKSNLHQFITVLNEKAGYILDPTHLILPSHEQFAYESLESRQKITKLTNELRQEGLLHEPFFSWIDTFEIFKNECGTLDLYKERYNLETEETECRDLSQYDDESKIIVLQPDFCGTKSPCSNFYQLYHHWSTFIRKTESEILQRKYNASKRKQHTEDGKEDGKEDEEEYEEEEEEEYQNMLVFTKQKKNPKNLQDVYPLLHVLTPYLYQNLNNLNVNEYHEILRSRITFMQHIDIDKEEQGLENVVKLKTILEKYEIKGAYFFSEYMALYTQSINFYSEYKMEYITYLLIFLFLFLLFNAKKIIVVFQFWFISQLFTFYWIYLFKLNTDRTLIIFTRVVTIISLCHYIYTLIIFSDKEYTQKPFVKKQLMCVPYVVYLTLFIISGPFNDYASSVMRILILNHIIWFGILHIVLMCFYIIYTNKSRSSKFN